MRAGYADQNGQKYEAIGKFLTSIIPVEQITSQDVEAYLRKISEQDARELLFQNPSYVFFRKLDGPAVSSLGIPVVAGRTIATDPRFFPKGALAFLSFQKPRFDSSTDAKPSAWEKTSRLVLDQDTGGAIRGGGRLDLFWGSGNEAKQYAGRIKQQGTLYYLVPKLSDSNSASN